MFPPLGPDDPPERGKSWTIGHMISQHRAILVARALFPAEVTDGSECSPFCSICAENNETWTQRVRQVRAAMMEAFK